MSMLLIWMLGCAALGIVAFLMGRDLRVAPKIDTGRADRMWELSQEFWSTGECPVCECVHFDHLDGCDLHEYLGGDPE